MSTQNGTAMIFVIVLAMIGSIVLGSFFFASQSTMKKSGARKVEVDVLNIAEAGKERVLAQLRNREIRPRASQTDSVVYYNNLFSSGSYTVRYSTNARNDTIRIHSIGKAGDASAEIEVIALLTPFNWRSWIKGAVTARTKVETTGGIVIDGRDHDTTGGLLATGGTLGVSSGGEVTVDGSSAIGGGSTPPQTSTIEGETVNSNIDTTGYPPTPEAVLGLPPGTLDSFKKSSCPSSPLSGITYVDDACNSDGSGILICHNSTGTASLKNYHGKFKGLIIADEDQHVNSGSYVLGAVIMLGKTVGGNVFGNGNASVLYSSLMVEESVKNAYDSANKRWAVPVISWRQVK